MLRTETSNLPPEVRARLHPDFLANEREYLRVRDALLPDYRGRWIAFHQGQVVAAGDDLMTVLDAGVAVNCHVYVARVGEEERVVFRTRRQEFPYDTTYLPFPLPRASVTFWNDTETSAHTFQDVIPDTGADTCVLPDADCQVFDLFSSPSIPGLAGGFVGGTVAAVFYRGKVEVNSVRVSALIQSVPGGDERLLGRNVLNRHRVIFDGPQQRVVFEP